MIFRRNIGAISILIFLGLETGCTHPKTPVIKTCNEIDALTRDSATQLFIPLQMEKTGEEVLSEIREKLPDSSMFQPKSIGCIFPNGDTVSGYIFIRHFKTIFCGTLPYSTSLFMDRNSRLLRNGDLTSIKEFTQNFKPGIPENNNDDYPNCIKIKWDTHTNADSLHYLVHFIQETYVDLARKMAQKIFQKELCALSALEMKQLKKSLDFRLYFPFHEETPPPPLYPN